MSCKSKEKGLLQFISHFRQHRYREGDPFYFGEEIEYMLIKFDSENKTVDVLPESLAVLEKLWQCSGQRNVWGPEWSSYMLESSPDKPYHGLITSPSDIEQDMTIRRKEVQSLLSDNEQLLTIPSFPRLGNVKNSDSTIIHPDDLVTNLPRYQSLKSCMLKIIQQDVDLRVPAMSTLKAEQAIVMDSLTYGYGCCGLQVTLQAPNLLTCMNLYDQLVNIAPIMLALSAASPIHNGYLANVDSRWKLLTELPIARKVEISKNNNITGYGRLHRFESVHCYVCQDNQNLNDTAIDIDKITFKKLKEEGCYPGFALYIANLFSRTPLNLPTNTDCVDVEHYLNIQNSNWQTVRIKVPSKTSGWTVEFRPMDVQVTDFENTAYVVFVMLLAKVIIECKLNLAVPISKVNENMDKASMVNSVKKEKFYMPRNIFTENALKELSVVKDTRFLNEDCNKNKTRNGVNKINQELGFECYSVEDIICGGDGFVGLLPIIRYYLKLNDLTGYDTYLKLIEDRASGTIPTTARSIRDFVLAHPSYHSDSKVNEQVQYDLLQTIAKHTVENTVMGSRTEVCCQKRQKCIA